MDTLRQFVALYISAIFILMYFWITGMGTLLSLENPQKFKSNLSPTGYLSLFLSMASGFGLSITMLFTLGMLHMLSSSIVIATAATSTIVSIFALQKNKAAFKNSIPSLKIFVFLAFFLAILVLSAMHPPGHWDDTSYHLPLARWYIQNRNLALYEYSRFPLFPQNMNLLMAASLLSKDVLQAQLVATLPVFVMGVGLLWLSVKLTGSAFIGAFTSLTLLILEPIRAHLGYAYVDSGLALFCFAAAVAVLQWEESEEPDQIFWLVLAGFFAGIGAGTKLFGAFFALFMAAYIFIRDRRFKSVSVFASVLTVFGSWWYLRSLIISGDPVHPLGGEFFGYFLWNSGDLATQKAEQAMHGVPPSTFNVPGALIKAGFGIWLLALVALFSKNKAKVLIGLQYFFAAYLAFWFFTSQVSRYLAPIYAIGTFLSWYGAYKLYQMSALSTLMEKAGHKTRTTCAAVTIAACTLFLAFQWGIQARDGMNHYASQLAQRQGQRLFQAAQTHIDTYGNRLLQLGFENAAYFFDGTVIGDMFGPGRYSELTQCQNMACQALPAGQLLMAMQRFGAGQFVVSKDKFPSFDSTKYTDTFTILMQDAHGVLLAPKNHGKEPVDSTQAP